MSISEMKDEFTNWIILPGNLDVGKKLGSVSLAPPLDMQCEYSIVPGRDWNVEQILLFFGLSGVDAPVRILAPVPGEAMLIYNDGRRESFNDSRCVQDRMKDGRD